MKISFSIRLAFFTIIRFGILNFGHCNLFVIWNLWFVFSGLSGLGYKQLIGGSHETS